jgi:ketosteroid isomerase-like protein
LLCRLTRNKKKDLADPQKTQKMLAGAKAYAEAANNRDAAASAAFFTRDELFVTPDGPITGREAIQKWHRDLFQWWRPENCISKVDGNAYHVIGTAGNEVWATGQWSDSGQGKLANLFQSRTIGYAFMFVRAMIGRFGWMPGTQTRRVSYSSTRVGRAIPKVTHGKNFKLLNCFFALRSYQRLVILQRSYGTSRLENKAAIHQRKNFDQQWCEPDQPSRPLEGATIAPCCPGFR